MNARLNLSEVTLCAAACVNVGATLRAMERCLEQADFGRAILFTNAELADLPAGIERVSIVPLRSSHEYSRFILLELSQWIETTHCLIVQWDGFILDPEAWDPALLELDYVGAPWPQFQDGDDVGNGGFSLRSKRLLDACSAPGFVVTDEPEDLVIARRNRHWLEKACNMRFADRTTASRFSFERDHTAPQTFGFHGVFNLPEAVGADGFWDIYSRLDDKATVWTDFWPLLVRLAKGPQRVKRCGKFMLDWMSAGFP